MEQTSGKIEISCGVIPWVEALCLLKQLWEILTFSHSFNTKASQIFLYSCNFHHLQREYSLSKEVKSIKVFLFVFLTNICNLKKLTWSWDLVNSFSLILHLTLPRRVQSAPVTEGLFPQAANAAFCGDTAPTHGCCLVIRAGTHISYLLMN